MEISVIICLFGIGIFFILLLLRIPVALSMVCVGIGGNYALSFVVDYLPFHLYIKQFKTLLWGVIANYELTVIPLFILMGHICAKAGLSKDLFYGIRYFTRSIKNGVLIATLLACAAFGAVSGSSLATSSTMGKTVLPELKKLKYNSILSTGVLASGGTLGILIPPSTVLVLYAVMVEASVIDMFQAAIIPGIFALIIFILVTYAMSYVYPSTELEKRIEKKDILHLSPSQKRLLKIRTFPILVIFIMIILGLGLGLMTPTPAAAVSVGLVLLYVGFLRLCKMSQFSKSDLKSCFQDTASIVGMIYFILFGAEVLKGFITRSGLPLFLSEWVMASDINGWVILICFLLILILLGFFLESLTMILVVLPFFWPVLVTLNGGAIVTEEQAFFGLTHDQLKIWFGILSLAIVELGLITPPMGLNVFIIASLDKSLAMSDIFRGVMPFFAGEIIRIALLIAFPILCLWLPMIL